MTSWVPHGVPRIHFENHGFLPHSSCLKHVHTQLCSEHPSVQWGHQGPTHSALSGRPLPSSHWGPQSPEAVATLATTCAGWQDNGTHGSSLATRVYKSLQARAQTYVCPAFLSRCPVATSIFLCHWAPQTSTLPGHFHTNPSPHRSWSPAPRGPRQQGRVPGSLSWRKVLPALGFLPTPLPWQGECSGREPFGTGLLAVVAGPPHPCKGGSDLHGV